MRKDIVLTPEEMKELKDEIKFRERVILQLKNLNGVPKKVWKLEVWTGIHTTIMVGIILAIISFAFRVMANGK